MQMLMVILKSVYMNRDKVNTRVHSTALIAYMAFLGNLAGLYQSMMYLIMKMFNLEVVTNTFYFYIILFSLSCSLIYNMGITISQKTQMLLKIKLLFIAS